jgi:hypothetical protein
MKLTFHKFLVLFFVMALWALPIERAIRYLVYATQIYREAESINAYNDYGYGWRLLVSYIIGLASMSGIVLAIHLTGWKWLWLPLTIMAFITCEVIKGKPEEVIVFFRAINPVMLGLFYFALGFPGLFAIADLRMKKVYERSGSSGL